MLAKRFKLGAAVAGISIVGMLAAVPASAEGVVGTAPGTGVDGFRVNVGGVGDNPEAMLLDLTLSNGAKLKVYCVEIRTDLVNTQNGMQEVAFDKFPDRASPFVKNSSKINFVLHNGFPAVSLAALANTLTKAGATVHSGLSETEAITATQAAIWHFSDGTDLNQNDPLVDINDRGTEQDVLALYNFLIGPANVGIEAVPKATLQLSPANSAGQIGTRVGPFTVATTGKITKVAGNLPEGVRITDKDGNTLDAAAVKNGTELFFDVPEGTPAGEATVELTGTAKVDTGRLFVGRGNPRGQSLIVAASDVTELTTTASATFSETPVQGETTPPPAPQAAAAQENLATTGASTLIPISLGVGLVAGGALMLLLRRRRI